MCERKKSKKADEARKREGERARERKVKREPPIRFALSKAPLPPLSTLQLDFALGRTVDVATLQPRGRGREQRTSGERRRQEKEEGR